MTTKRINDFSHLPLLEPNYDAILAISPYWSLPKHQRQISRLPKGPERSGHSFPGTLSRNSGNMIFMIFIPF